MMMSDKMDDFESKMLNTRNFIVAKFLTAFMSIAEWAVTNFKSKTDLDSLLAIKNISDKMEAELAGELRSRNSFKKHASVKTFDRPVQPVQEVRVVEEQEAETQYFEASDGSMNDEEPPFEVNREIAKNNRISSNLAHSNRTGKMSQEYSSKLAQSTRLKSSTISDLKSSQYQSV